MAVLPSNSIFAGERVDILWAIWWKIPRIDIRYPKEHETTPIVLPYRLMQNDAEHQLVTFRVDITKHHETRHPVKLTSQPVNPVLLELSIYVSFGFFGGWSHYLGIWSGTWFTNLEELKATKSHHGIPKSVPVFTTVRGRLLDLHIVQNEAWRYGARHRNMLCAFRKVVLQKTAKTRSD